MDRWLNADLTDYADWGSKVKRIGFFFQIGLGFVGFK